MKNTPCELSKKTCVACRGDMPALIPEEGKRLLGQLQQGWEVRMDGHLWRKFEFKDFVTAMQFAHRVGEVAEAENHHPDLHVGWGRCGVEIWTHKVGGLTESDFILAAKIDQVRL